MNKWILLDRPPYKELWQLIDTEKEAENYPYLYDSIKKGSRKLPVAMNRVGGVQEINANEYVQIIISEQRPFIAAEEMYPVDQPDFKCGWISPNGTCYGCASNGHMNLAETLAMQFYKHEDNRPDQYLLEQGWAKVSKGGRACFHHDRPSKAALEKLVDLNIESDLAEAYLNLELYRMKAKRKRKK